MRWKTTRQLLCVTAFAAAGCGNAPDDVTSTHSAAVGDVLSGLQVSSPDLLDEADEAFRAVEQITDGVGPIFNERSCGGCHLEGAVGGSGPNTERRFGRFVNGIFDPLANLGGTLRQLFTVANFNNPNLPAASRGRCQPGNPTLCCVPAEVDPPQATVRNVGRVTTSLFGLGLVDAIPDSFFAAWRRRSRRRSAASSIACRCSCPTRAIPPRRVLSTRVGRFGWKAGVPTLTQFSADAYNNEMAITTQSCFRGAPVNTFALENAPNAPAGTFLDGCDDLAPRQTGRQPGRPDRRAVGAGRRRGRRVHRQPHRDPGRRLPVHRVHDRAGAGAARLQRSDRDHPRRSAVHQRRLRRLPRAHHVPHAGEPGADHHRRGRRGEHPRAGELRVQSVLRFPEARHGRAGRHDRRRAARRSGAGAG